MPVPIDLRSDTVTLPTEEMYEAMRTAPVGDDVLGEDPTVRRLEEAAAARLGKEAGLFFPSGTMANLAALLAHTRRGDEVILEAESHIVYYEAAGLAVAGALMPRPLPGHYGALDPDQVAEAIRPDDVHFPRTGLVCLENTHNRAGGTVISLEQTRAVCAVAHAAGIPVHIDGARIFNAALALGLDAAALVADADSVMFSLSKGLSAPVGSVLVGNRAFIAAARRARKLLGGGMRQAGVIAAAGLVALERMVDRLVEDHAHARLLGERLAAVPGVAVDLATVQTNMVRFSTAPCGLEAPQFVARLREHGVLAGARDRWTIRMVTHRHITAADVEAAAAAVRAVAAEALAAARPGDRAARG
ncbi:MAG TPA: GntG family PLP-dependent aldolase [Chloroflexota bacterium]|nr:GntG family PLP-dependent aldolase [Chloroflexota bacterium]